MVTLASEVKLLLGASGRAANQMGVDNGTRTFAMGPEDVKKIIESRFLKKSKDAGGGRRGAGQARVQARLAARGHVDCWSSPEQLSKRACADDRRTTRTRTRTGTGTPRCAASARRAPPDRLEPKSLAGPSTVNY